MNMDEKNLDLKYVVLKIEDIDRELDAIERTHLWELVNKIIIRRTRTRNNVKNNIRALVDPKLAKEEKDLGLIDLEEELKKL